MGYLEGWNGVFYRHIPDARFISQSDNSLFVCPPSLCYEKFRFLSNTPCDYQGIKFLSIIDGYIIYGSIQKFYFKNDLLKGIYDFTVNSEVLKCRT